MKKIGIIGASSAIGETLARSLALNNYEVLAFSRQQHISKLINIIWIKLPDFNKHKIDVLIYAAPIKTLLNNLTIIEGLDPDQIIIVSSTSKYTKEHSKSISERNLVDAICSAEEIIKSWAINRKKSCVLLRPTMIYGGKRNRNIAEISRVIRKLKVFPVVGKASGLRQPIHVDDLSEACLRIVKKNIHGNREYNLSGGEVITYREMVERVFKAMQIPARFVVVPDGLFRAAILFMRIFPRFRYLNANMASRMNADMNFDHTSATEDLGFSPRAFQLSSEDVE